MSVVGDPAGDADAAPVWHPVGRAASNVISRPVGRPLPRPASPPRPAPRVPADDEPQPRPEFRPPQATGSPADLDRVMGRGTASAVSVSQQAGEAITGPAPLPVGPPPELVDRLTRLGVA
jgi:hypothetical protein